MNVIRQRTINRRFRLLLVSALIALPILVLTLALSNMRWTLGSEKAELMWFEHLRRSWMGTNSNDSILESLLVIDVHDDRHVVPVIDADGDENGKEAIVNHEHLLELLRELNAIGNYRYILLDVFLEAEISQPADSLLYQLIASMPRIVIPKRSKPLADSCLLSKAARAQYGTAMWEGDFVKYPFWTDNERSIPLVMYEEMMGKRVEEYGPFLIEGCHLIRSSTILTYNVLEDHIDKYPLEFIVEDSVDSTMFFTPEDVRGKYVLIGDFTSDRHHTYLGDMSGVFINYNAYLSLLQGHHHFSFRILIGLYLVFLFLVMVTIHYFRVTRFVMWLGYPFVLGVVCLVLYVFTNQAYDVLWATLSFYLLEKMVSLWNQRETICKKIQPYITKIVTFKSNIVIWLKKMVSTK